MRCLPGVLAFLAFGLSLTACDSSEPAGPVAPLRGTYVGEWQGADAVHVLSVTLDQAGEGDFAGEARLIRRRGPLTGGALLFPLRGDRTGEALRFVAPIALDYRLDFVGTGGDSAIVGRLRGTLPPESPSGAGEAVETDITLVRDGLVVP